VSSRAAVAAPAAPARRVIHRAPPIVVPRGPRRLSGPARRAAPDRGVRAPATSGGGIVLGLIAALERIANHRLLDRLLRGRAWIGLVAFALIGIVTMQLGLLKLSGGIGRAIEREALLQRENAALSIENSELAAGERVQSLATRLGMELVPTGALRFLTANPRTDLTKAAAAVSASARATPRSSEESGEASTTTASTQAASAEAQAPTSTPTEPPSGAAEQSSAASGEAASRGEGTSHSESASSGESHARSGESATAPGESTASATPASGSEPSGAAAPGTSGSAEAGPAGGTQAGPQG
jgi:cell division protein FtsL